MYWQHILHVLMWGYFHIHHVGPLFRFYIRHHAVAFLNSGVTSGSGGRGYVWRLTIHHISPVDW